MQKLSEAPALSERGNIVQRPTLIASAKTIGGHLARWQEQAASLAPGERSMRARASQILIKRFAELERLHAELRLSTIGVVEPFTVDDLAEVQLRSSAAIGASLLLGTEAVQEYLRGSGIAAPDEDAPVCFDPGARDLRWHAAHGAVTDLVPGYESDRLPDQWYAGDGIYLHVRSSAAPTTAFEESYLEYFGEEFKPGEYATVTPVTMAASMQSVAELAVSGMTVFRVVPLSVPGASRA